MGKPQDQVPGTENFQKNQALFQKYTAIDWSLKHQIITAVEPVFLYLLVDQLIRLRQVSSLTMLQNLFSSYGTIDEINLEENYVDVMGPYDPA